jgi:mannose-6-phosphate isomerase-like protein (cupin superfamily)
MDDGTSAFDEVDVELNDAGTLGNLSKPYAASSVIFRETSSNFEFHWHQAPHRQYFVLLEGEIEIECGTSEKRRFRAGDTLLLEDTRGTGHRTRTTDGKPGRSLFIRLDG